MVKTLVNYGHLAILRDGHQSIDRGEYIHYIHYVQNPCMSYTMFLPGNHGTYCIGSSKKIGGYASTWHFVHGEKMFFLLGFSSV